MPPGLIWLHYLTLWPGPHSYGPWQEARELIAYAIGRNRIPDPERHTVRALRDSCSTDAEALHRLAQSGFNPGDTNRQLSRALSWVMLVNRNLKAYVQWEIAAALGGRYGELRERIIVLWPHAHHPATFNSMDVTSIAVQHGFGQTGRRPMVLASDDHRARAMLVVRKLLHQTPCAPPSRIRVYDPNSIQWWTSSRRNWLLYEPRARVHHLLHRWVW